MNKYRRTISGAFPVFDASVPLPDFDSEVDSSDDSPSSPCAKSGTVPTVNRSGRLPYITSRTLVQMLNNEYGVKDVKILDCRFAPEYDGGHIKGALHIFDPCRLKDMFFSEEPETTAIVFHCELSQNRGPTLAGLFREIDRHLNQYPALSYHQVFILEGGYREFYKRYPEHCDGDYRPMRASGQANGVYHAMFTQRVKDAREAMHPSTHAVARSPISKRKRIVSRSIPIMRNAI